MKEFLESCNAVESREAEEQAVSMVSSFMAVSARAAPKADAVDFIRGLCDLMLIGRERRR